MILYGLKNCDRSRGALQSLTAAGYDVAFRDLRQEPVEEAVLQRWWAHLGEDLLNRRSTTWRGLSLEDQAVAPLELLQKYPGLLKRPIIEADGKLSCGWDATRRQLWLGEKTSKDENQR